ncbi:MAG: poly granule associated protein [Ramlibacter sp.]|nr:poly granule associated protein [Ramlibacter sp.]
MVTKTTRTESDDAAGGPPPDFTGAVKESAQQIWLAGLGAFAKAQEEGSKVFDSLVKEGMSMQRKTQSAAGEKLSEATSRMTTMASDLSSRASGQWDKLETIFEGRVSKALNKLGVPTAEDIELLSARIEELNRHMSSFAAKTGAGKAAAGAGEGETGKSGAKPAAKRKPAKKSP